MRVKQKNLRTMPWLFFMKSFARLNRHFETAFVDSFSFNFFHEFLIIWRDRSLALTRSKLFDFLHASQGCQRKTFFDQLLFLIEKTFLQPNKCRLKKLWSPIWNRSQNPFHPGSTLSPKLLGRSDLWPVSIPYVLYSHFRCFFLEKFKF